MLSKAGGKLPQQNILSQLAEIYNNFFINYLVSLLHFLAMIVQDIQMHKLKILD